MAAELRGIRAMIEGFDGLVRDVMTELRAVRQREEAREAAGQEITGAAMSAGRGVPQPRQRGTGRPPLRLITGTG